MSGEQEIWVEVGRRYETQGVRLSEVVEGKEEVLDGEGNEAFLLPLGIDQTSCIYHIILSDIYLSRVQNKNLEELILTVQQVTTGFNSNYVVPPRLLNHRLILPQHFLAF